MNNLAAILRMLFRGRPVYGHDGSPLFAVPATLPAGTVGEDYPAFQLRHRGGTPDGPVRWDVVAGSTLGVPLTETGLLGGDTSAPSGAGRADFEATVTDLTTGVASAPQAYSFTATEALQMVATPAPDGVVGAPYTYTFQAVGGRAPRTFVLAAALPAWATFNAGTGAVTGTPTSSGPLTLAALCRDVDSRQTAAYSTTATIQPALAITSVSIGQFAAGASITGTLSATGLVGTPTWSVAGADGLTIDPTTGELGGSVATAGDYQVTAAVTDQANGRAATRVLVLSITAVSSAPSITTPTTLSPGTTGVTYDTTLAATPGTSGITYWTIRAHPGTTGAPPGWGLDLLSGRLYGSTTVAGDYTIRVRATDESDANAYDEVTLTVRVRAAPVIAQPAAQEWTVGTAASVQLVVTGGYGSVTVSRVSGSYPTGINAVTSGGLVAGTPTAEFTGAPLRFVATDADGRTSNIVSLSIVVDSPVVVTSDAWPEMTAGTLFTSPTPTQTGVDGTPLWSLVSVPASWSGHSINSSTGVVTHTPDAGDVGSGTVVIRCTDDPGTQSGTYSFQTVVNAAASAPVVNPISNVVAVVGSAIVIPLSASGGDPPYNTWETQSALPSGLTIETLGDGTGRIVGTRSSALAATSISVRCTDDSSNVASYVSFTLTVNAAAATTSDHDYLASLPDMVIAERFDTATAVHGYGFGAIYRNDPNRLSNRDPAYIQWVDSTHPDAAVRKDGHAGCMKFYIPSTVGESSFAWARMFDDSWAITDGDGAAFTKGLGEGNVDDEFWIAYDVEITEEWCLSYGGGGGPKLCIINRIAAHNDENEGQMYHGNGNHRGVLQGVCDGGYGFHDPDEYRWRRSITVSGVSREVLQPAVDHSQTPLAHPAGLTPPAQGTQAYDDWRYGGVLDFAPSETTGAVKFLRDMAGQKCRVLTHLKMGTWGNPDSVWETWIALPGKDYIKLHGTDERLFDLATETLSGFRNDAYGQSGSIVGTTCPGGGHPINMIHLLHQETGRSGTTGNPAKVIYWHGYYTRRGAVGIPAPGFTLPPQSAYGTGGNGSGGGGGSTATVLNSAVNAQPRATDAIPGSWTSEAAGSEILTPWSEMAHDVTRNAFYMHGGGHLTDSHYNGLLRYALSSDGTPQGWTEEAGSAVGSLRAGTSSNGYTYSDGLPAAVHTYRSTAVSNSGNYYRCGGSVYSSGGNVPLLWEFDVDTAQWTSYPVPSGVIRTDYFGPHLVHDWVNDLLILFATEVTGGSYCTFNPTTKVFSSVRSVVHSGNVLPFGLANSNDGMVDLCRVNGEFRLVVCGSMRTAGRQTVLVWNGSTFGTRAALTASGAEAAAMHTSADAGFSWDRENECFWGWNPVSYPNRVFKGTWTSATNIDWSYRDFVMNWTGDAPNAGYHKIFPVYGRTGIILFRNTTDYPRLVTKW